jgi:lactate permease
MIWPQNYNPLDHLALSSLVAALPVVVLLGLLAFWHVRTQVAALAGLIVAAIVAIGVYHMPASLAAAAALNGAAFGLFPIGWIVLNAMFIYNLSVETGQFALLQRQVANLSADRRIQALLIAFSFGAFIEGAAGFGAPVAISGALMIGLGFKPLEAAKLALIGNTAPVAFGSLGTPLTTLADITGLPLLDLSAMVGRQLPIFSLLVPFWLVAAQAGWRGMVEVWPACLITGASFGLMQCLMSNLHGPWLVDIVSAVVSMSALVLWIRCRGERARHDDPDATRALQPAWRPWLPWAFLTLLVFVWGLPQVKSALNGLWSAELHVPLLDQTVQRMPPAVPKPEIEKALFKFNPLSATGSAALLAGVLAGLCLGLKPARLAEVYLKTLGQLRVSLLTIALMLALGYVTRFSGTDTTLGLMMASSGSFFPFFSPLIGWLGVALTGSDTSSNVLFGNLQQVSAAQLGLNPVHMAASNSSGGVMGKMIDAQSIVVAAVATGGKADSPDAGSILRAVFWHSIALAILMGLLVAAQAAWMPWLLPTAK